MGSITIIAELGVNMNGELDTAVKMVRAAKASGADIAKFQSFDAERLGRPDLKWLEMSDADLAYLSALCISEGIEFCATPFHEEKVDILVQLGVKRIKISSGKVRDLPLMRRVGATGLPVIISNGMATDADMEEAFSAIGPSRLTPLYCVSKYPARDVEINLSEIGRLKDITGLDVGYSDHAQTVGWCVAAAAMGATVIEKHFTLSRSLPGPDHACSAEPHEFRHMVEQIRALS